MLRADIFPGLRAHRRAFLEDPCGIAEGISLGRVLEHLHRLLAGAVLLGLRLSVVGEFQVASHCLNNRAFGQGPQISSSWTPWGPNLQVRSTLAICLRGGRRVRHVHISGRIVLAA